MRQVDGMPKAASFSIKLILLITLAGVAGCNFASNDDQIGLEDNSASGAVAAVIGGALLAGNPSSGISDYSCPTVASTSGCTTSGSGVTLSYNTCTYGAASGTRTGALAIVSGGLTCGGSLPASMVQQYSVGSLHESKNQMSTTFDDWTGSVSNFAGDSISPLSGGGYGVQLASGSMTIARHLVTGSTNYSVVTAAAPTSASVSYVPITISSGTASGAAIVYDNVNGIIGVSTLNSLVYQAGCCFPVSGSISTQFHQSWNPAHPATATGLMYDGKTETLSFSGCGSATYTDPFTSTATSLSFTHCY
jgi:hypothetical protein